MKLIDVLVQFGFDRNGRARLARHQDNRREVNFKALLEDGDFEEYQSWQARPVFHNVDTVVSFIGDGGGRARFRGVYRVVGNRLIPHNKLPNRNWPWKENRSHFRYKMKWLPEYETLVDKLVIEWINERTWVQHLKNYRVLECPVLRDIDLPTWSPLFVEGKAFTRLATSRERSREAREKCLEVHGCRCAVCEMAFPEAYGGLGEGFMHVHHSTTVASQKSEYQLNPTTDLTPVCPNCHAMMHWNTEKPRTVKELRKLRR